MMVLDDKLTFGGEGSDIRKVARKMGSTNTTNNTMVKKTNKKSNSINEMQT